MPTKSEAQLERMWSLLLEYGMTTGPIEFNDRSSHKQQPLLASWIMDHGGSARSAAFAIAAMHVMWIDCWHSHNSARRGGVECVLYGTWYQVLCTVRMAGGAIALVLVRRTGNWYTVPRAQVPAREMTTAKKIMWMHRPAAVTPAAHGCADDSYDHWDLMDDSSSPPSLLLLFFYSAPAPFHTLLTPRSNVQRFSSSIVHSIL